MAKLRDDAIEAEISLVGGVLDVDAGVHRAPYPALRAEDFELLLYALYKERKKSDSFYDNVTLMITGADRGRDVWLTSAERPVGLVQCKRTAPGFTAPAAIREVIKFLLFAEADPTLLPDPQSFKYALALGSDPAGTTVALFAAPKQWLSSNNGKIAGYIVEVIKKYASFKAIDPLAVLPRVKERLNALSYELIRPVDLDAMLEEAPTVRARFFRTRQVIDLVNASALLEEKFKAVGLGPPRQALNALAQSLIDSEVEKDGERLRRSRFYTSFNLEAEAKRLAERLSEGDYAQASDAVRARAMAACARWLSRSAEPEYVSALIAKATNLGDSEEAVIADAFLAARSNWKDGLAALSPISDGARSTAALQIVLKNGGPSAALDWSDTAGITPEDLDSDGRYVRLSCLLEVRRWEDAYASAVALRADDFAATPAVLHLAAAARLVRVVPFDMRALILNGPPLDARSFPLKDDEQSLVERREAIRLFREAETAAASLKSGSAKDYGAYALWLELRDPERKEQALSELEALLSDGEQAIRYIHLGLSFGVKLDLKAIERVLDRQETLDPNGSVETALARFALVTAREDANAAAEYLARHRALMLQHLNPPAILEMEVRTLVAAGREETARGRLDEAGDTLDAATKERLLQLIGRGPEGPTVADMEEVYAREPTTANLAHLVNRLGAQGFSDRFFELARKLVLETRTRVDAEGIVNLLLRNDRFDEMAILLADIPEIVRTSPDLRSAKAWALYREGKFNEAAKEVEALRAERDEANDRALLINVLIQSGRWAELPAFVEAEWMAHASRSAEELYGIAQLAGRVNSPRLPELLQLAAAAGHDNPHILLGCYMTAVQAGREDDAHVHQWMQRAVDLSGEDGPVQMASLEDMIAQAPDWERHVDDVWEKLRLGEVPLSVAAELLRRPSLELQLSAIVANRQQHDPRRRSVVPAFSGNRGEVSSSADSIGLDLSALVTLASVDILERIIDRPGGVHIPHSTLGWLFHERQRLSFHQPSQTKAAHALTRSIAAKRLRLFAASANPDPELTALIGRQLALMLSSARAAPNDSQTLVVRSSPVHKVGSLLNETADLESYKAHLCSCSAVLDKLIARGQLTQEEESRARAYLRRNEERWLMEPVVEDGAELYLDDLSVSYLRSAGLLEKLHAAGLTAYVSDREVREAHALIELEAQSEAIEAIIEQIRAPLSDGIARGAVRPDRLFTDDELRGHPNVAVVQLARKVDAIICDDRFMNQHRSMDSEEGSAAIWTSLDLLAALKADEVITEEALWRYRTSLRQGGLILFPTQVEELLAYLQRSTAHEGVLVETGELRAFRENLLLGQMRGWLVLPREAPWLHKLTTDIVEAIRAQWVEEISDADARARSRWLLRCADIRNWAGTITDNDGMNMARYGLAATINSLLMGYFGLPSDEAAERFAAWLEEDVVAVLKRDEPTIYAWLLDSLRLILASRLGDDEGSVAGL